MKLEVKAALTHKSVEILLPTVKKRPIKSHLLLLITRFERGRVILRKGHLGRSAYMIFKGSVVMIEKDTEDTNLIIEEDDEEISKIGTVLKNGDCFGVCLLHDLCKEMHS